MKLSHKTFIVATTLLTGCSVAPKNLVPTLDMQLNSVVSVETKSGSCSGWILKGTHIVVTAAHCSEGQTYADSYKVTFKDGTSVPMYVGKMGDQTRQTAPDYMTLVSSDRTIKWPVGLPICTKPVYYGEAVHLLGDPMGLRQSISFGHIGYPRRDFTKELGTYGQSIQYDGVMIPGNSGGPAVDDVEGCVVGISSFGLHNDIFVENFLAPIDYLADLK